MTGALVALTGATGFVGKATLAALARSGMQVRALARTVPADRAGAEWMQGDLSDTAALARLVEGAEAVIHVAGLTTAPDAAAFEAANVAGTLNVLKAAADAGVRRFVCVSSLAAREPSLSAYGASKERAERLVASSGLDWTVVRPPGVYGPWDRDYLEIFKLAKKGIVPVPPPGRSSLIHVQDLAELLVTLLPGGEDVTHAVFEPDDGHAGGWTHRELARIIGWAVGRRPWVVHLSRPLLEHASRADRLVRRSRARLTKDRVGYMTHPDWVARPEFHVPPTLWKPRIPTREGLRATARWYREKGWL
ncbi:3 beta-hydroxysteroid dehydrogenase/Delta 5--_4-isomerase [Tsuneonella dongtanensis]|uniref:3 beta-hydroxysteroid dehydrogenase/Delta 5-->4-isomerase n=1 Tax=Tsuneonella dongtanensis TaxID=692370 RepID=A0A1B2AD10_9SPHN|nr:NAD(P)-dependent oxidoreductase [Tsuneonella dongtanensis]ANY20033.1 3 beta-hydroxysteroid dehydrogenase/Delta 5-->4-isomerase [Tsuneonella dongtanensis]